MRGGRALVLFLLGLSESEPLRRRRPAVVSDLDRELPARCAAVAGGWPVLGVVVSADDGSGRVVLRLGKRGKM